MLSGNPGHYDKDKGLPVRTDGSWISSLQEYILRERSDVKLGLFFIRGDGTFRKELNNTIYYNTPKPSKIFSLRNIINFSTIDNYYLEYIKNAVEDFNPDIIEVFGSETVLGLVYKVTKKPIILHIQGIMVPYYDAWYPPLFSERNVFSKQGGTFVSKWRDKKYLNHQVSREKDILHNIKYYFGRTTWDRDVIKILSPNSNYFYCSEMLRENFLKIKDGWTFKNRQKIHLISVISDAIYKGCDVILKIAELLTQMNVDYEWNICGISEMKTIEAITRLNHTNYNIELRGKVDSKALCELILDSSVYVHMAYIENSPNSVCEAQMLGIPVVAANVGGVSSLIQDGYNGFLVPANDRFTAAARILKLATDEETATSISRNARITAQYRHDPNRILEDLFNAFSHILNRV